MRCGGLDGFYEHDGMLSWDDMMVILGWQCVILRWHVSCGESKRSRSRKQALLNRVTKFNDKLIPHLEAKGNWGTSSRDEGFPNLTEIRRSWDDRCLEKTKIVSSQEGFQCPGTTFSRLDRTANPKMTVVLGLAVTDQGAFYHGKIWVSM